MADVVGFFDLDGTLINVYRHHTPAYQFGIEEVYGVELSKAEIERNFGMPAPEVVAIPLRAYGLEEKKIQDGLQDVFQLYELELMSRIKSSDEREVLPGARETLETIVDRGIPLGVITGNIRTAGETILRAANLIDYFSPDLLTYGDNVRNRTALVRAAFGQAEGVELLTDSKYAVVFGDTDKDVVAARKNGGVAVGVVRTGWDDGTKKGEERYDERVTMLEQAGAHFILDDFTNPKETLAILQEAGERE